MVFFVFLLPLFEPLPRVPKLFQPQVACPVCSYANGEVFHFCQNCGYKRRAVTTDVPPKKRLLRSVDESEIKARLDILAQKKEATSFVKQKSELELELSEFLFAATQEHLFGSSHRYCKMSCLEGWGRSHCCS